MLSICSADDDIALSRTAQVSGTNFYCTQPAWYLPTPLLKLRPPPRAPPPLPGFKANLRQSLLQEASSARLPSQALSRLLLDSKLSVSAPRQLGCLHPTAAACVAREITDGREESRRGTSLCWGEGAGDKISSSLPNPAGPRNRGAGKCHAQLSGPSPNPSLLGGLIPGQHSPQRPRTFGKEWG